jgi:hypothetical protein
MASANPNRSILALQYVPAGNAKGWSPGWYDIYVPAYRRTDLPAPDGERILPEVESILRNEGFDLILSLQGVLYAARRESL